MPSLKVLKVRPIEIFSVMMCLGDAPTRQSDVIDLTEGVDLTGHLTSPFDFEMACISIMAATCTSLEDLHQILPKRCRRSVKLWLAHS